MCHHYRIADREALGETAEEREDEPAVELGPSEPELKREETEREPPAPTADD